VVVDVGTARRRLATARVGHLATVTAANRAHVVPCCFVLLADTVYSPIDAKPKSTLALRRLQNIESNGAASLLVDHYEEDWDRLWWVRVDGNGRTVEEAVERDEAIDLLRAKYEQYGSISIPGPVLAIDIEHWRMWP
jgi:PPOX class probable F420-dependent enzyme